MLDQTTTTVSRPLAVPMKGAGAPEPFSTNAALEQLDQIIRRGEIGWLERLPTGFQVLDRVLDGGFGPGNLILVGGAQSVGKTTLTLQMARNFVAKTAGACAYVCFEHDEAALLQRLIAMESFLARAKDDDVPDMADLRQVFVEATNAAHGSADGRAPGLAAALQRHPATSAAFEQLQAFGQRLYLVKASGEDTGIAAMHSLVRDLKARHGSQVTLFVDYLQKVPIFPPNLDETERTTLLTNELKDLALEEDIVVVAVVAADREGLRAQRLRLHHLRGSSSFAYEADVILILNNKYRIIAKRSIAFNPFQAQEYRNWVVCSIEKNRSGRDQIDVEFRVAFANAAFDPTGKIVEDSLIDERTEE